MFASHFTKRRAALLIPSTALLCLFIAAGFSHPIHAAHKATGAHAKLVRQGKRIFNFTPQHASKWTSSSLSCSDCHLIGGTVPDAAPLVNIANLYPKYSKRAGHKISLAQRIQECFIRSENGKPMPLHSPEMRALVAYIQSLSNTGGKPRQSLAHLPSLTGNVARGKSLYATQCSVCHQANGQGLPGAYPPLWGTHSYNNGAGMHRIPNIAAWIQHNMPMNAPGSLTPQQAFDVAAYIHSKPLPKLNPAYKHY